MEKIEVQNPEEDIQKKLEKFKELGDEQVATSGLIHELFKAGQEKEIEERVNRIDNSYSKNEALFVLAKLYYEIKKDLDRALELANQISDEDEKTRCLVHLAMAVLDKEKDVAKADNIIADIKEDQNNYREYYFKARADLEK